jgi:hypothetical protein
MNFVDEKTLQRNLVSHISDRYLSYFYNHEAKLLLGLGMRSRQSFIGFSFSVRVGWGATALRWSPAL